MERLRGLLKSMEPDSKVKKREGLTKTFLKLNDNKWTEVKINQAVRESQI